MSRLAIEANLRSLLIIIHGSDSSTSSSNLVNGQFKELERIKLMDNTIAKFVFMNEEPGQLTLCELITDNIENDALKNFSRTSVKFFFKYLANKLLTGFICINILYNINGNFIGMAYILLCATISICTR